jgi:heat shock protein HtpX
MISKGPNSGAIQVEGRDFFSAQRRHRRWSVALMVGLFVLLWAVVNFLGVAMHSDEVCTTQYTCETTYHWNIPALVITGVLVAAYLVVGVWWGSRRLVVGHGVRAADGPEAAQLRNVVEEMAIASGAPVPQVFILEDSARNAYAVSDGRRNGAVVVTSGLLGVLDRRELSGVVAHELAHIRNRDSRVLLVTMYVAGAIVAAATFFVLLSNAVMGAVRRTRGRSKVVVGALGLCFVLLAAIFRFIAVPAALLMRAALSRRREQLADASAVQYTRDPTGLRSALEKIAAGDHTPKVGMLAKALCIEQPDLVARPKFFDKWMDTHPPIEERIVWLRMLEGAIGQVGTTSTVVEHMSVTIPPNSFRERKVFRHRVLPAVLGFLVVAWIGGTLMGQQPDKATSAGIASAAPNATVGSDLSQTTSFDPFDAAVADVDVPESTTAASTVEAAPAVSASTDPTTTPVAPTTPPLTTAPTLPAVITQPPQPLIPVPTPTAAPRGDCEPSYPDFCLPPSSADSLNCDDIPYTYFTVLPPDPHDFDGNEDGEGCES